MGTTCTGAYRGRDEKHPNVWELHVQGTYRGRDEKRPNVWELHVQGTYRRRDEKRPNVWELHVQGPTEGGMRNVLMRENYMYRGLQGEG